MGPEYFIPRDQFLEAFKKIREMKPILAPVLRGIEIRPVDGDNFLMSPAYKQKVIAIHFNFSIDKRCKEITRKLERVLWRYTHGIHWAKNHEYTRKMIFRKYKWRAFRFKKLSYKLDPKRKFENEYFINYFGDEKVVFEL